jgi:hypothetical protein
MLAVLALGAACVDDYPSFDERSGDLWDSNVVGAADGLYINLPFAGDLIRLNPSGITVVDLNGAVPARIVSSPDGSQVLAFASWTECKDEDPEIVFPEDCDSDELSKHSVLEIIQNATVQAEVDIPSHLNTVSFSEDGEIAVAYLDYEAGGEFEVNGFADLGEVAFIRLTDGTKGSASVGFSPKQVLFSPDNQAVVMSRSQVVAVDLDTFEKTLEAPLTLDADQAIDPSNAELAFDPDSGVTNLLLTVQGSSDLFMLDLVSKYWNIGNLGAIPSTMGVDNDTAKSVFVFASNSKAVILDHSQLSTLNESSLKDVDLEEPANSVQIGAGFALLYNDSSNAVHDVYKLDLSSDDPVLTEYVVSNPVDQMYLTESGRYAVAVVRPESSSGSGMDYYQDANWGLSILDLTSDESVSLVAEREPVGIALVEDAENSYAVALLAGSDTLLQVNLAQPNSAVEVDLPAAAISISALPDGNFAIAHNQSLGMISILDPSTLELQTMSNFAATNLFEQKELPRRGEEAE